MIGMAVLWFCRKIQPYDLIAKNFIHKACILGSAVWSIKLNVTFSFYFCSRTAFIWFVYGMFIFVFGCYFVCFNGTFFRFFFYQGPRYDSHDWSVVTENQLTLNICWWIYWITGFSWHFSKRKYIRFYCSLKMSLWIHFMNITSFNNVSLSMEKSFHCLMSSPSLGNKHIKTTLCVEPPSILNTFIANSTHK